MNEEEKTMTRFPIPFALFWGIVTTVIGAAFGLGIYFGKSIFDDGKIKCFQERNEQHLKIAVLRDSIIILEDSISRLCPCPSISESRDIFDGYLHSGYDMIVDTSGGLHDWVEVADGEIRMHYPGRQNWGVAAINKGKPTSVVSKRGKEDFSKYKTLSVELKGDKGSVVEIGLKDIADGDNGYETKIPLTLKEDWTPYEIPLDKFVTADLTKLYIVTEFVFGGKAQTVYVRKIKFKK